jgi:mRNA interferase MazF
VVKAAFGDIVTAAGGGYTGKPRPVLVFQNQSIPTGESVIVIPLTSAANPAVSPRLAVDPTARNGLDRRCFLEVDKLSAIRSDWLGAHVGRLEEEPLAQAVELAHQLLSPGPPGQDAGAPAGGPDV